MTDPRCRCTHTAAVHADTDGERTACRAATCRCESWRPRPPSIVEREVDTMLDGSVRSVVENWGTAP